MASDNIIEQSKPKPVIARRKGEIGAVMIDPKTGKPIPDTWVPKAEVPEKALKYLDPAKFAAAEKRNKDRQAQIDAEKQRLKGVGTSGTQKPQVQPPEVQKPQVQKPQVQKPQVQRPSALPTATIKASDQVSKYMAAASAARKSGDPTEMAKVRDMGMDIWKAKYKDTLAKKVSPTGQQLGTGQSEMAKQSAQLRALRPAPQAPGNEKSGYSGPPTPTAPQAQSKLSGGPYSSSATKLMSQRTKNILGFKEQYDAYDIVLEYLFSQGHVDTLEEALYVMMEMNSENINNIIQERAWWDPAGVFMTKREKEVEKVKSTATGSGASYNPNTGRTYNPSAKDQSRATGVIAPRGGIVGTMEPGKPKTWQRYAPGSDAFRRQNIDRYVTVRGRDQLQIDNLANRAMKDKARRDAAADAAIDRKYGVNQPPGDEFAGARKNTRTFAQPAATTPRISPKPVVSTPKPQPSTIQSKNVTATGTSYERRTPTSAEMAASKKAGGGEAGIKAAVDVAKSNKIAATSPTPSLKPETLKKRESLVSQAKELKATRERIEKEGIKPVKMESYDIVLEYLFSQGHVDTLEEALYVMMEMDATCIQSIVEGDPSFQIKRSTGAGALTPSAAAQLGQKAIELQKKKAAGVDLPNLKQSPGSMIQGV
jgi:hypothetical protein